MHCAERGELLQVIHEHYSRMFSRLTEGREREIEELHKTYARELQRQTAVSSKGAQTALLFQRGATAAFIQKAHEAQAAATQAQVQA